MIWFTSDQHFSHSNIIDYCNRPFDDVNEMNEEIIDRHNEVVGPNDTVYNLGDFAFFRNADITEWIDLLNGKQVFIKGNHDKWLGADELPQILEITPRVKNGHKQKVIMCHYPLASWNGSFHGSIHVFGHCHGNYEPKGKSLDVGVDCWDFYPVSLEQIEEKLNVD